MTAGSVSVPQIIPLRVPLPGKAKHEIDTNTLVEIKSDTPDVSIYYTLDGSKPELLKRAGYGENNTFKYSGPITLPDGKILIKAMAVTRTCKESGIVTKTFLVDYKSPNLVSSDEDNDENFFKDLTKQELRDGHLGPKQRKADINVGSKPDYNVTFPKFQDGKVDQKSDLRILKDPYYSKDPMEVSDYQEDLASASSTHQFTSSTDITSRKTLTRTQASRVPREADFLKCSRCLAPRPSDPFARFCQECGSPVPPTLSRHLLPLEGAQMGLCGECRTRVPMNTLNCIVCETPLATQLQSPASTHLKRKIICLTCGTGNPIHLKHCVTCESPLPETQAPIIKGETTPPPSTWRGKTISCPKCGRRNCCDARFCDWCGTKPSRPACYFTCTKCGACNPIHARFCGCCGVYTESLERLDSEKCMLLNPGDASEFSELQSAWQPLIVSLSAIQDRKDKSTQTIGLFYPSSKELEKKELELVSQKENQEKMSDRKPLLTAISPGKGYWRKQLDHICAHLRSYAQNNPEFRVVIGEPRMGKLLSAMVQEDGFEVNIRLNYIQITKKDSHTSKPTKSNSHFLSDVTEGRNGMYSSQDSLVSEKSQGTSGTENKEKRTKKKTRKYLAKEEKLSPENRSLLKEVSLKGKGSVSLIEELLDEGADPNCKNSEDRPVLTVAVLNMHHEAIPILVQKGADIDQPSGPLRNTALHEATLLEGVKCIEVLLGCNASIKKKNEKGMSAYDLALKTGNDQIISLFAARLGQGMLSQLTQFKNSKLNDF
ncbi:double zinc ribbon and ankyrin repeat-containing protein 1 isoform X2 [Ornithorhynchus anatinus]|uniref:double zinc ribbon and ankyrin repeat-containing protein 1 isoform X2 n=1 Tax=Ornithorhynchus anatinus TaxID=9258 RepID=UPI0010A915F1|nr:double zinc ribbon and ankyrin repeat-containing protein 1 isoform X2 [Ornithorhynchus anatinus]